MLMLLASRQRQRSVLRPRLKNGYLGVGYSPIVQDLEQHVEHVRMRFFHLIKLRTGVIWIQM